MFGAIFGDMVGAPYEFNNIHTEDFPLISRKTEFTDDTVMTVAVADALMETLGGTDTEIRKALVRKMKRYGHAFPDAGYGGMFRKWLFTAMDTPYNSFGNGSAMRVSAAGWMYDTLAETEHAAMLSAAVTHDHPEGIKGAQAVAAAMFLARTGSTKEEIMKYVTDTYGYDLEETVDSIRTWYYFNETCQKTVPQALRVFYESNDYEQTIRKAVSIGGDSDTLACIAGGIAEAFWGMPEDLKQKCRERLDGRLLKVADDFEKRFEKNEAAE